MTVDFVLRPAVAADEERLYAIHKAALGEYVEATWGWDEAWQRQYFRDPARIPTNRTWKQMYAWRTNDQKW